MKKLLFICLVIISCKSKSQEGTKDTFNVSKAIDTLKVDESLLTTTEKQYLKTVDSLAATIDSKSLLVVQKIENDKGQIHGYSEEQKGSVIKIIASGKDNDHDVVYAFYYVAGKVVKITSLEKVYPPFYSAIYFLGDRVFKPNQLSERSAEAIRIQSIRFAFMFNNGKSAKSKTSD